MTSDSLPPSPDHRQQDHRQQAQADLAGLVNNIIEHEDRKTQATIQEMCRKREVTTAGFAELVLRSNLVSEEEWERFKTDNPAADLLSWTGRMQAVGLLSNWQIQKMLSGKYKGFQVGNYQVRSVLGQGLAGAVYHGQHQTMRRPVALKVLGERVIRKQESVGVAFQRLGLLSDLDHAHVVHYFDVGEFNRAVYMVMEIIQGRSAMQTIRRYRHLPLGVVQEVGRQLADALAYVTSESGVHARCVADNILFDNQGNAHISPLDLTNVLALDDCSFDATSATSAIERWRELLCQLENGDDPTVAGATEQRATSQPSELEASELGSWHTWTTAQIADAGASADPWAEAASWLN
jgi:serine/threonine protein kinase